MGKMILRITKYPLLVIMGLIIIITLITYIVKPDTEFSDMENRYLRARPSVSISTLASGDFMTSFEDYTKDQLPLRNAYIKCKAVCEMILLKCENNGIIRGGESFLFEKTISESDQLSKNMAAIRNFAKEYKRDIYIALAPNSVFAYSDKLPYGAPVLDDGMVFAKLSKQLEDLDNAHLVNLIQVIEDERNNSESDLYYRTDHHWTSDAAFVAYQAIMQEMGQTSITLESLASHEIDDFYGTSYAKYKGLCIAADKIIYYDIPVKSYMADGVVHDGLMDLDKFSTYDKYSAFMYGNPGLAHIEGELSDNDRGLIVFKDSYANCLLPFLACSYNDITVVDLRYCKESVADILSQNEDKDILLLYNCSFMNEDNHFYKLVQ